MSVRPHPLKGSDPRFSASWVIDYKGADGKRHQDVFHGPEHDALNAERSLRTQGKGVSATRFPALNEVSPLFLQYYALDHQPSGYERLSNSFKKIMPFFGKYQFPSITPQLIEQYKRQRLEQGVKPTTINKELAGLSSFCKWADEQGYCHDVKIKRFPQKLTRAPVPNVPSRKTVVKFLRAIPRKKRGIFAVLYYLGLRVQGARGIKADSIHWDKGVLVVLEKGNKQRVIPMSRKARPYLRHAPFEAPGDLRQTIKWACKRAGITQHIHPHLLRHAFGCHMTAAGVGLRALQTIMGHSSPVITERYSQIMAETLILEMNKF